ncbi:MAG: tRNA pseudouridine55 synthase [Thermosediminibacterales bacterium]|nr:tRNA pseudouridine55 synthase [Thermosediminibacterales bacterium]
MDGILNILKPPGMTSHDVVDFIRHLTKTKVGHTGTLDPDAAGVLVLCVGKATKISKFLTETQKAYRAEITFGISTDTYDASGKIVAAAQHVDIKEEDLKNVFERFKGDILQVPPMTSAIKYKGKPLYKLAHKGENVKLKPRKVTIYNINIVNHVSNNKSIIDVECSKGTYIRSLCNDIGEALGCGAFLSCLIRTKVGNFHLKDSITLEEVKDLYENKMLEKVLYPMDFPLQHLKSVDIKPVFYKKVLNGNPLYSESFDNVTCLKSDENVRLYCNNNFIAIGKVKTNNNITFIKPIKVFN